VPPRYLVLFEFQSADFDNTAAEVCGVCSQDRHAAAAAWIRTGCRATT